MFGIIIDSTKDIPMIWTTLTDRAKTPRSDEDLFFYSPGDLFFNSRNVAASLHNDMQELSWEGLGKLYEWPLAYIAWMNDNSTQQQIETEMMEKQSPQSYASRSASRKLHVSVKCIRLISIHNHNIRILSTVITEEYFLSFREDSPPSSSKLHVHIKSISVAGYNDAEMKDLANELLSTKEQVGPLEAVHILP
ncbi:predicted protein [Sclerotinia sclerotiorum 1980 UF-70]|uniref:Uncharacterized protein n=1 Tax=Sclerotinia sclerotiorum (strain ATCC 18683 / 1980 / Ss-1) TaxID=665079 RepID=A7F945_SCLS1|nr:predicted protein [Sclerotinia sclerotiorum 1980 UF-70]EDO00256.1 predicted protein [Sclerotinia sclerotiorum 1980 UF-70]